MSALLSDRRWLIALFASCAAALSALLLLGAAGWLLAATAVAGAAGFGLVAPALLIRVLAVFRIGGKYTERLVGHAAALQDQTAHRAVLFRRMAGDAETARSGWQLARADRLQHFLTDVDAVDFRRLRVVLPALGLAFCCFLALLVTVAAVPRSLFPLTVLASALTASSMVLAGRAARRRVRSATLRTLSGERMGLDLASLVSLQAQGQRHAAASQAAAGFRDAEALDRSAQSDLSLADALLGMAGPLCALIVLVTGVAENSLGTDALPVVLTAFIWLACGEVIAPFAKMRFADLEASRASRALDRYHDEHTHRAAIAGGDLVVQDAPLADPEGQPLGGRVSFTASQGKPVAIVGPSGCGKTSLLKRLAGWLAWSGGDHPLGTEDRARVSSHLSLHDAAILEGTLRDNLFTDAPEAEMMAVLVEMELADRAEALGGLLGHVGQSSLSLGEARRVALARAALATQPVILLDEPGEHLDADQAERVLKRLLSRLEDRTVVFVTHDERLAALGAQVVHLH
ncbi:MAG: ATP-binding cassette domain-containing protein [Pseudomonadota bacterium]